MESLGGFVGLCSLRPMRFCTMFHTFRHTCYQEEVEKLIGECNTGTRQEIANKRETLSLERGGNDGFEIK